MEVNINNKGTICVVSIKGDIDIYSDQMVADALEKASQDSKGLIVDLSKTGYLDSSGIAVLANLARHLTRSGKYLRLVAPRRNPIKLTLELVGLDRLVPIDIALDRSLSRMSAEMVEQTTVFARRGALSAI